MLLTYITFIVICGTVFSTSSVDYTPEERARVLGPFANVGVDFPCKDLQPSPEVPTSVHKLRPGDIKYVGAIGDSLTAANGANAATIIGLLTEYRGVAWSIGGVETLDTTITLPNILRKFNKDLYGYSIGNGNQNSANAVFNAAKTGAVSYDMPGQAQLLIDRMKKSLGEDEFKNSWKLVTLFIGGNDLCAICDYEEYYSPANYINNIKGALDILFDQMPRAFINVVTILNVAELEDLHDGFTCQTMQGFLCKCAINENTREGVRAATLQYQLHTNDLVANGAYDKKDDFTVVIQPFMEHMTVPRTPSGDPDFTFFAPDCFHFSKKGHGSAAVELWNNMMEPVGKKTKVWNLADTLHCPSTEGFIYTAKNSN